MDIGAIALIGGGAAMLLSQLGKKKNPQQGDGSVPPNGSGAGAGGQQPGGPDVGGIIGSAVGVVGSAVSAIVPIIAAAGGGGGAAAAAGGTAAAGATGATASTTATTTATTAATTTAAAGTAVSFGMIGAVAYVYLGPMIFIGAMIAMQIAEAQRNWRNLRAAHGGKRFLGAILEFEQTNFDTIITKLRDEFNKLGPPYRDWNPADTAAAPRLTLNGYGRFGAEQVYRPAGGVINAVLPGGGVNPATMPYTFTRDYFSAAQSDAVGLATQLQRYNYYYVNSVDPRLPQAAMNFLRAYLRALAWTRYDAMNKALRNYYTSIIGWNSRGTAGIYDWTAKDVDIYSTDPAELYGVIQSFYQQLPLSFTPPTKIPTDFATLRNMAMQLQQLVMPKVPYTVMEARQRFIGVSLAVTQAAEQGYGDTWPGDMEFTTWILDHLGLRNQGWSQDTWLVPGENGRRPVIVDSAGTGWGIDVVRSREAQKAVVYGGPGLSIADAEKQGGFSGFLFGSTRLGDADSPLPAVLEQKSGMLLPLAIAGGAYWLLKKPSRKRSR